APGSLRSRGARSVVASPAGRHPAPGQAWGAGPLPPPLPALLEPLIPASEIAQPLRGACPQKPGQARSRPEIDRLGSELLRSHEAALEQRLDRAQRRFVARLLLAAPSKSANV